MPTCWASLRNVSSACTPAGSSLGYSSETVFASKVGLQRAQKTGVGSVGAGRHLVGVFGRGGFDPHRVIADHRFSALEGLVEGAGADRHHALRDELDARIVEQLLRARLPLDLAGDDRAAVEDQRVALNAVEVVVDGVDRRLSRGGRLGRLHSAAVVVDPPDGDRRARRLPSLAPGVGQERARVRAAAAGAGGGRAAGCRRRARRAGPSARATAAAAPASAHHGRGRDGGENTSRSADGRSSFLDNCAPPHQS